MSAAPAFAWRKSDIEFLEPRTLGGPGSGNFGHAGRPGKEGGSVTAGFLPASQISAKRLAALRLPPAWTNVRVNPDPKGGLQAVGIDKKGREQPRYSVDHSAKKDAEKFERTKAFHKVQGELRKQIRRDLTSDDPVTRDAAAVLLLIEKTAFRAGSGADTKADVKAYGANMLLAEHVTVKGNEVHFTFIAKKGVPVDRIIVDRELAQMLGPRVKAGGPLFSATYGQVLKYMKQQQPGFTPKDYRTWHATSMALAAVQSVPVPRGAKQFKAARAAVAEHVSAFLGNEPGEALKSYIDKAVFARWERYRHGK